MKQTQHPGTPYRPDIDGLRAVAVLGVVACHADLGLPGGYAGVDVFFVISGYLIAGLILKDVEQGTFSSAHFWERRVRRILPALAVVTVATLAVGWVTLTPDAYAALGRSAAAVAVTGSNFHFWRNTNYFAEAAEEKLLLHTWSLAVEEQFYLFAPAIVFLVARAGRQRRVVRVLAAAAASLALSVYGLLRYPAAAFYLLPTRAWELLAGVLLAFRRGGAGRLGPWRCSRPWVSRPWYYRTSPMITRRRSPAWLPFRLSSAHSS